MKGYRLNDNATRLLNDGWLKTGDLGYFDAEGFLYIIDRKNDMVVITGGENVFPTEVEGTSIATPTCSKRPSSASRIRNGSSGWSLRWSLKPGVRVTGEELIGRLRGQLAAYKCSKAIFFTSTLPKSAVE